jgi:hypothetical protein
MKNLLFLSVLFSLLMANAVAAIQETKLSKDDTSISLVKHGEIASVDMYFGTCPPNALCQPTKQITVKLTLNGCLDRLGPVTSNIVYDHDTGDYRLLMTATQIKNKRSALVRCFAPNWKFVKVVGLPRMEKENVRLELSKKMVGGAVVPEVGCPRVYRPVCGVKPRVCPPGMFCPAVMPAPKTYANRCLLNKDGARFLYEGRCKNETNWGGNN